MSDLLLFARDNGLRLNLELKPCSGRTRATTMVALIEATTLWPDSAPPPLISSFDIDALVIASQLHPEWPRGLLLDDWRDDWRELAVQTRASTLNFNADLLTPERLTLLKTAHLPILAYTVNDAKQAVSLLQNGVSAVFSDDPAALLPALSAVT